MESVLVNASASVILTANRFNLTHPDSIHSRDENYLRTLKVPHPDQPEDQMKHIVSLVIGTGVVVLIFAAVLILNFWIVHRRRTNRSQDRESNEKQKSVPRSISEACIRDNKGRKSGKYSKKSTLPTWYEDEEDENADNLTEVVEIDLDD